MTGIPKEPDGSWASESISNAKKKVKLDSNIIIMPLMKQNEGKDDEQLKYDTEHGGPFVVYIDNRCKDQERKPINAITISNVLKKFNLDGIDEVVKVGYGRVKVGYRNAEVANSVCYDRRLKDKGYEPKILQHCLSKTGLIFDIPTDIPDEELLQDLKSPIPIMKIIRVERRDREDKEKKIPTRRIKIFFKGQKLPSHIYYAYTKIDVKPFIPLTQCYRCFRFNHFAQNCKEQQEKCKKCFQVHSEEEQCKKVVCVNCKHEHAPTSKDCPARVKAFIIKRTMTLENATYKEAQKKLTSILGNRFEILDGYNEQFPPIQKRTRDFQMETRKDTTAYIHEILPYNKVVKYNQNRIREEMNASNTMQEWRDAIQPINLNEIRIETQKIKDTQDSFNELNLAITKHLTSNVNERLNHSTIELFNNIRTTINKINNIFDSTLITNSTNTRRLGHNNNLT
ncbi:PREDICTED: uncharacterized protein LOC108380461 [Rhagoletis zephyria]|uniref:uncharacterized protein LOC108380461 n=1 Tax=Rhagoletis zephyria TaxID=28612 RepID=UPI00081147BE|nr:PREDICTED: uncharacterized protein LOC108380461 [Rhagoletis zephyria]